MNYAAFFPVWTKKDLALALKRFNDRPRGVSRNAIAREIAVELGRTTNSVKAKLYKLTMTPEKKERWLETERRRYQSRVPAYRSRTELEIISHRPTAEALQEHAARCRAPVRDLTAAMCGDPPVGYSALERRT